MEPDQSSFLVYSSPVLGDEVITRKLGFILFIHVLCPSSLLAHHRASQGPMIHLGSGAITGHTQCAHGSKDVCMFLTIPNQNLLFNTILLYYNEAQCYSFATACVSFIKMRRPPSSQKCDPDFTSMVAPHGQIKRQT